MSRTITFANGGQINTCCHRHPRDCKCPTYEYVVEGSNDWDDPYEVRCQPGYSTVPGESAAEFAAEDYHADHDGWEDQWPITVAIRVAGEREILGTFEVDREMELAFSASPKENT